MWRFLWTAELSLSSNSKKNSIPVIINSYFMKLLERSCRTLFGLVIVPSWLLVLSLIVVHNFDVSRSLSSEQLHGWHFLLPLPEFHPSCRSVYKKSVKQNLGSMMEKQQ
jgi:hypothetical protein